MSIIKSSQSDQAAQAVRPLSTPRSAAPVDPKLAALAKDLSEAQAQGAALAAELADRDARIGRLEEQLAEAVGQARAEGREAGLREAEDDGARRFERLDKTLDAALNRFAVETERMERLAVALAAEGLRKIIGDVDVHHDLLARTIRHHVDAIGGGTVIEVAVSRDDFADPEALARLASGVDRSELRLVASPDLASGDCQLRLKLGAMEIGVDRQWERLNALFADLGARSAAE